MKPLFFEKRDSAKRVVVVAAGFTAGALVAAMLRPQQAQATDCLAAEPTTAEVVTLDVPEGDRAFWEAHTIDIYSHNFNAVGSADGDDSGYWEIERLGDVSAEAAE